MGVSKCFAVILILILNESFGVESVCDSDWLPYGSELCFKILDIPTRSYADALKACDVLEGSPTLPIIESTEQQDFLVNLLFKIEKKVNNFWLGAKFSGSTIKWSDESALTYTNWDKDAPRNKANYCVQMQSDEAHLGKWIDEPCERDNAVVCQKAQLWSSGQLQKIVKDIRKELKDSLDKANKEIMELKQKNEESNTKIHNITQNPIPVGFIYVQLSFQPEPRILWPTVEWADVSTEYAGLFFRAEGGRAAQFGTIQKENAPRVSEVSQRSQPGGVRSDWTETVLTAGEWSSGVGIYSGSLYGTDHYTHIFYQTGGEVRPRNSAIRIWKRAK